MQNTGNATEELELPVNPGAEQAFGSDVVADAIRATGVPFIALTPGASFRGLHDSLVNYLGNRDPQMLVCLHEEHAVALAHGYAKVTGVPLAVALHSNVGLMHATMAIFNAWCDRMPMLIIGATGPIDAAKRRPWIDWIHTARDQGALVRPYVKWDDQPASPLAAREAVWRGFWLARSAPCAPVYINLDVEMQEGRLAAPVPPADPDRYMPQMTYSPGQAEVERLETLLSDAQRPLILFGRGSRDPKAWAARVAVAERFGAKVMTDIKVGATFPTDHPLHAIPPSTFPSTEGGRLIREADLLVSFDWVDLEGTLKTAWGDQTRAQQVVQITLDHHVHNGWSTDHQALAAVDMFVAADPDLTALALAATAELAATAGYVLSEPAQTPLAGKADVAKVASALWQACEDRDVSLLHLPISWDGGFWPFRHPLDFIGGEGGAGIGAGPGVAIGAALALRGSGRLPIAVTGDGDFIMGCNAIWTATHYRIPLLMIILNNKSFFNDEVHQERVARMRGRPHENRWIGQRLDDPEISIVQLASAQGATTFGPVDQAADLLGVFAAAIAAVDRGEVVVVDVRIPAEYLASIADSMTTLKA
ncbi:thiamine pyrophosphate-binding protein [Brevundimonas sp.]|uniref:thiamine pyrophosphate-binding protein n=1 Tax=Brevundimonas sp. TaxID=1871086 RepID=UPI00260F9B5F|nr:thiamine pyrophosphate-binding protein [Brevundimonas sp.]